MKQINSQSLANTWNKLLDDKSSPQETDGCEKGEEALSFEDIKSLPEGDKNDPGYHVMIEEEIVDNVI